MKSYAALLLCLFAVAGLAQSPASPAPDEMTIKPEPPMLGAHFIHGESSDEVKAQGHARHHSDASTSSSSSDDMTWHGGAVLSSTVVVPIFWGTKWGKSSFAGDKITGLMDFYQGVGGSSYAMTADEYAGSNGQVTSSISYSAHYVDTSSAPSSAPGTSVIQSEVCKVLSAHHVKPVANGYYAVYIDKPRGSANYCAWHSYGTCNRIPVQFSFFFDLDGDLGCDPGDSSGLHSQGLAALANVSGHELSEARTDPRFAGWWDSAGSEIGDKCAWAFGPSLLRFTNGHQWKIQGNWSNNAYNNIGPAGFANLDGQTGCVDGSTTYP
jgi:hypothetical protein